MGVEPRQLSDFQGHDLRREVAWIIDVSGRFVGDPGRLVEPARLSKVLPFLDAGPQPRSMSQIAEAARQRTATVKPAALALGREGPDLLAARGLRPVHLKDPLRQVELLGSPCVRPGGDIDIPVRARDRAAVGSALGKAGSAAWTARLGTWRTLVQGGTHLRRPPGSDQPSPRLNQPGLLPARHLDTLIDDAREQAWQGATLLVPLRPNQAVVAALGVVKVATCKERSHLVDFRAALDRLDARRERRDLRARVGRLGLEGVLALATQGPDAALPQAVGRGWGRAPDPGAAWPTATPGSC